MLIVFTLLTNTLGLRPIMANTVEGDIDNADATRFELMYHLLGTTVAGEYIPRWVTAKPFISPEALAIALGGESPAVHVPTSDPSIEVHRVDEGHQRADVRRGGARGRPHRAEHGLLPWLACRGEWPAGRHWDHPAPRD